MGLYSLAEVARMLDVEYWRILRAVKKGDLPSPPYKFGTTNVYDQPTIEVIRKWLDKQRATKEQIAKLKAELAKLKVS